MNQNQIAFNGKQYEVIDTMEYITLADSFVKNKIGSGHGEAKLYVGNENERTLGFFDNFDRRCLIRKSDLAKYMLDARGEYIYPQQCYKNKSEMPEKYTDLLNSINEYKKEFLWFHIYRSDIEPPRVYINSNSEYYSIIREIGLPNISYVSILKLKDEKNEIFYYFRMFIDYFADGRTFSPEEANEKQNILSNKKISERKKAQIIEARIGQGEYREKLLLECPFCPITFVNDERLLIASHIKPWAKSDDREKIDPKNGFIFTPTYDKLFDRGFFTFEDDGNMIVSPWLSPMNQKRLNIYTGKKIKNLPLDDSRKAYLKYHRENIFKA